MNENVVLPFIFLSLAVYRVSIMLSSEDGPFYLFGTIRRKLIDWERRRGKPHWVIDGFHCPLCIAVYLSFFGTLFLPFTDLVSYFILSLAVSSITVILKKKLP